jgi:hypothetical protein
VGERQGLSKFKYQLPAVNLGAGRTAEDISAGAYATCARQADGSAKCWGEYYGAAASLVRLGRDRTAVSRSNGVDHAGAVLEDNSTIYWGAGSVGKLGYGDEARRESTDTIGQCLPAIELSFEVPWLSVKLQMIAHQPAVWGTTTLAQRLCAARPVVACRA